MVCLRVLWSPCKTTSHIKPFLDAWFPFGIFNFFYRNAEPHRLSQLAERDLSPAPKENMTQAPAAEAE
jgi:hypothetical protein